MQGMSKRAFPFPVLYDKIKCNMNGNGTARKDYRYDDID